MAAVIGREFSYRVLSAALPQPEMAGTALQEMIRAGLIVANGEPPHATYTFKHALVRDATYATLLRSQRKALHARLARILEEKFPEMADKEPELLARHYTGADMPESAIRYWRKAGEQSLRRFANAEAISHFSEALRLDLLAFESHEACGIEWPRLGYAT